jgi:hypothetical protein
MKKTYDHNKPIRPWRLGIYCDDVMDDYRHFKDKDIADAFGKSWVISDRPIYPR